MNMSKKSSEEAIELMSCTEVEAEEEEVSKPHKRNHQKPHSIGMIIGFFFLHRLLQFS